MMSHLTSTPDSTRVAVHKDHVIESLAPLISIITTECPEAEQYEAAKGLEYLLRHCKNVIYFIVTFSAKILVSAAPVLRELKHDDTIIKSLIRIKLTAKKASLIDAATRMLELFEREVRRPSKDFSKQVSDQDRFQSEEDNNDIPDLSTPAVKFAPNVEVRRDTLLMVFVANVADDSRIPQVLTRVSTQSIKQLRSNFV